MTTNPESLLAEVFGVLSAIPIGEFPGATYREKEATAVRCLNALKSEMDATRPAPPAQPGREEVVETLDCVGLAVWCVSIADHHADTLTPKQIEKLYAASDALRAAEPLLARQDGRVIEGNIPPFVSAPDFDDRAEERVCINGCLYLRADFAARRFARQDVRPEAEPVARADNFNGSTAHLLDCIDAFLDLTDDKAFVPHNLDKGSHAYRLLVAARVRLEASIQSEAKTAAALVNALADNAHPATLPTEPASVREERLREALRNIDEKASIHSSTLALEVTNIARAALSTLEPKL